MSAFVLAITVGLTTGSGPVPVSGEVKESFLLVGKWQGTVTTDSGIVLTVKAHMTGNQLHLAFSGRGSWNASYKVIEEDGRLQLEHVGLEEYLGIYRLKGEQVLLCLRIKDEGKWPTAFQADKGQHLFILHRVKPRK
jgi:hypothetical protein